MNRINQAELNTEYNQIPTLDYRQSNKSTIQQIIDRIKKLCEITGHRYNNIQKEFHAQKIALQGQAQYKPYDWTRLITSQIASILHNTLYDIIRHRLKILQAKIQIFTVNLNLHQKISSHPKRCAIIIIINAVTNPNKNHRNLSTTVNKTLHTLCASVGLLS